MRVFCKFAEGTELLVTLRVTANHVAEADGGRSCTVTLHSPKSIGMNRHNFTGFWSSPQPFVPASELKRRSLISDVNQITWNFLEQKEIAQHVCQGSVFLTGR